MHAQADQKFLLQTGWCAACLLPGNSCSSGCVCSPAGPATTAGITVALREQVCPVCGLQLLLVQVLSSGKTSSSVLLCGQLGAVLLPHACVPVPVQVFSLERSNVYIEEMVTRKFNVPFFVKSEHQFEQSYPSTSRER